MDESQRQVVERVGETLRPDAKLRRKLRRVIATNCGVSVRIITLQNVPETWSMPWEERSIVEERMRFVLRLKDGESMAPLCREFGISRVTGYKIYERYRE